MTIETEHLLLGILREDSNIVRRFLPSKTNDDIRVEVERGIVVKAKIPTNVDIPLSEQSERIILTYAMDEADTSGHRDVDVDHLLLGVVREEDGVAGQILRSAGLNLAAMRQRLDEAAAEYFERFATGSGLAVRNGLRKTPESVPVIGCRPAPPKIFVNHLHSVFRPAQRVSAFNQAVLPRRGLGVRKDLHRCRLTDVDKGTPLQVQRLYLVSHMDSPLSRSSLPEPKLDAPAWPTTPAAAAARTASANRSNHAPQARRRLVASFVSG